VRERRALSRTSRRSSGSRLTKVSRHRKSANERSNTSRARPDLAVAEEEEEEEEGQEEERVGGSGAGGSGGVPAVCLRWTRIL
jgi:hypothetical protein